MFQLFYKSFGFFDIYLPFPLNLDDFLGISVVHQRPATEVGTIFVVVVLVVVVAAVVVVVVVVVVVGLGTAAS